MRDPQPILDAPLLRPYAPEPRREMLIYRDEVIDAVVGYRTWRVVLTGGIVSLRSVFASGVRWHPGQALKVTCLCRGDVGSPLNHIPGACKGNCGIYAWAEGARSIDPRVNDPLWLRRVEFIHGEVYLWGTVKIHERGYKAEFALPAAFHAYTDVDPLVKLRTEMAAYQYGVPMVTVS